MQAAARGMARLGIAAEVVLTSPLVRCRQTAEIVCAELGGAPREDPRLAPGMGLDDLAGALAEHPGAASALVCGHQPDLSEAVAALTGGGMVEFRKGSLALLEVEAVAPGAGRLRALYPPSALRTLGRPQPE
jgi:phosphohistidine phosphatase SixA